MTAVKMATCVRDGTSRCYRTAAGRSRSRWRVLAATCAMLCAPGILAGQEEPDTFRLRELVVTATRLQTSVRDAPNAVTVVTGDELRARGIRYVTEALRGLPGVTVAQSGGPGALTSVFMRGGEADYVQVLVDGVQVNDPGGSFNWAHLRTEDVERIEIVRGPVSVLYGSDAVSGVVQIFTRAGGSPRLEVGATGGLGERPAAADGTYRSNAIDASLSGSATAAIAGATRVRYGASYSRHATNGLYAFNSDYDNTNISSKLGLSSGDADATFTLRRNENEFHYPTSGSGMVVDRNQAATSESVSLGADAGWRVQPWLELRVLATSFDGAARTDNPEDQPGQGSFWSTSDVRRESIDARANAQLFRAGVLTVGAEREWQRSQSAYESVSEFGTFTEETDERRRNTGVYAQLHGRAAGSIAATVGGRIDDNDAFGTFRTARAAVSWTPAARSRVHAALGTAFKEPTFFETFATGFARGNPQLEPESSRSWEIGGEQALLGGALVIGVTWFDQRFRNMIQYTDSPPSPSAPSYYNIARATARGAELMARAEAHGITLSGGYTYTRTRVEEEGFGGDRAFADGEPLVRRPRHQASVSALAPLTRALRASLDIVHTGRRIDLDFTDPVEWQGRRAELPAWTTIDLGGEARLLQRGGSALDVMVRVRNVLDARYDEIYNFPAPGRVLQLSGRAGLWF